jgi:phosphoribosylanthranilate isomerase
MTKFIKVCGMQELENIERLKQLSPDFMGFIFYPKSARYVGETFQMPEMPDSIHKVGVFVKESVEKVLEIAPKYGLTYVQLHSDESPEYCSKLKTAGIKVIKAFAVNDSFRFDALIPYEGKVDYFLFDTQGDGYGGHGKAFNWGILKDYSLSTPFFVAGGVSNGNIGDLLNISHPMFKGVDVNSKYEISAGLKDIDALKELFLTLRK